MERSIVRLLFSICCLVCGPANILFAQPSADQPNADVSSIAELISTPRRITAAKRQIRIRGTVSVVGGMLGDIETNPNDKSFCLEDESAGIWIRVKQAVDKGLLEDTTVLGDLQAGIEVEILGSLHPGGFAPVVLPRSITLLGAGELSEGIRPNVKDFFRGAYICLLYTSDAADE